MQRHRPHRSTLLKNTTNKKMEEKKMKGKKRTTNFKKSTNRTTNFYKLFAPKQFSIIFFIGSYQNTYLHRSFCNFMFLCSRDHLLAICTRITGDSDWSPNRWELVRIIESALKQINNLEKLSYIICQTLKSHFLTTGCSMENGSLRSLR